MGQPGIREIEASLAGWDFLQRLPREIGSFKLLPGTGVKGQILNIAAYANEAGRTRLDLTYTGETFDYVPVKNVGLHTFRDERYFCRGREHFAAQMLEHLPGILMGIDRTRPHKLPFEARALGFDKWQYWRGLPQKTGGYQLFITPDNPLAYINGSYIFLDYTDFERGNQVYFSYNVFRNELFAEKKKGWLPLTTDVFDVTDKSTGDRFKLDRLAELMDEHLEKTLEELGK